MDQPLSLRCCSPASPPATVPTGALAQTVEPPQTGQPVLRGMPPGFKATAAELGVAPDALFAVMTEAGGPQADLAVVAAQLGVSEVALREALPPPLPRS